MAYKSFSGTAGTGGTAQSPSGGPGGDAKYYYLSHTAGSDRVSVYGGSGGGGVSEGGVGGAGGYARAKLIPTPAVNTTGLDYSGARAFGGAGGNAHADQGGAFGGGRGGNAYAYAIAMNAQGTAAAEAYARGGAGGDSYGVPGGAAGSATITGVVSATGSSASAKAVQAGGSGGSSSAGGAGAPGASSKLDDMVTGTATGGAGSYVRLSQGAYGGQGGNGTITPGAGGYGKSYLTFDDLTTNPAHQAALLYGTANAVGAASGNYWNNGGTAPVGGAGTASIDMTGGGLVRGYAVAQGGTGGGAGGTPGHFAGGGVGGSATVTQAVAQSTSSSSSAGVQATATGGGGGAGEGSGESGGAGGAAILPVAMASGYNAGVTEAQIGGHGGGGFGGASGGKGADSVLLNQVTAATIAGASNPALGGRITLDQVAKGGSGGFSYDATPGAGGIGKSELAFNDAIQPVHAVYVTGDATAYGGNGGNAGVAGATATAFDGLIASRNVLARATAARGGAGGQSGLGGPAGDVLGGMTPGTAPGGTGGAASAIAKATSSTNQDDKITAGATANGGAGGTGWGVAGGTGGAATGAHAYAYAPNDATTGTSYAAATQGGGAGGTSYGAGTTGGQGGQASGTTAYAQGFNVTLRARQVGGAGGQGAGGGSGGAGADSKLENALTADVMGGALYLSQYAKGGAGGAGSVNGGIGGYADSQLGFNDLPANIQGMAGNPFPASVIHGKSYALAGGSGYGGVGGMAATTVPNGNTAYASQKLLGQYAVFADATTAVGGAGGGVEGGGLAGGKGGTASANAYAQSATTGTDRVSATATAQGGAGGAIIATGNGNGGAGGTAGPSYATAVEKTATGGVATAILIMRGGDGGEVLTTGNATGQVGGAGGAVVFGGEYAAVQVDGFNASGTLRAYGGSGGNGGNGAGGGAGAAVYSHNGVYGVTTGGYLDLTQAVTGGNGGAGSGGSAGPGGNAGSYLTRTDTTAATFNVTALATGGAGGSATGGAQAGSAGWAYAQTDATGMNAVTATSIATGGAGGSLGLGAGTPAAGGTAKAYAQAGRSSTGGDASITASALATGGRGSSVMQGATGGGGAGGAAIGAIAIADYDNPRSDDSASATETGGAGGTGRGAGNFGGDGGVVSGTYAGALDGILATATATQTGGAGGAGLDGASGGIGADSTLDDAVVVDPHVIDPGLAPLSQQADLNETATGGQGGGGASGGNGGAGTAILDTNLAPTPLAGIAATATGTGGAGGYGGNQGGDQGGAGGYGKAVNLFGGIMNVTDRAVAAGGAGGSGAIAGQGGGAYARAMAQTSGGANAATAIATGGAGGGGLGTGGNAFANSVSRAEGGTATATAIAAGGAGAITGTAKTIAMAHTGDGETALATTSTDGAVDNVEAEAATVFNGSTSGAAAAVTTTDGVGELQATASAALGGSTPIAEFNTDYAELDALPVTATIDTLLADEGIATSDIAALLGPVDTTATLLGYGLEGMVSQTATNSSQTVTDTESFHLTNAELSGSLILGLFDGALIGAGGFTNLDFTVQAGGVDLVNMAFGTESGAVAYFTDNAINLGALQASSPTGTDLVITTSVTSNVLGNGFAASFLLGSTGVNGLPTLHSYADSPLVGQGLETAIPGVSLSEAGNLTGVTFSGTIQAAKGTLFDSAAGVAGSASPELTINDATLSQFNAMLNALEVTEPVGSETSDTITFNVDDSLGQSATAYMAGIAVNGIPTFTVPAVAVVGLGQTDPISGVALSETGTPDNDNITVTLSDGNGKLADLNEFTDIADGAVIAGTNTTNLSITGSYTVINQALAHLVDLDATPGNDTIFLNAKDNTTGTVAAATQLAVTVNSGLTITVPVYGVHTGVGIATQVVGKNAADTATIPISLAESGNTGTPETFTITLNAVTSGPGPGTGLQVSDADAAGLSYVANGPTSVEFTGDLNDVNLALDDYLFADEWSPGGGSIMVNASDSLGDVATPQTINLSVYDTVAQAEALTQANLVALAGHDDVREIPVRGSGPLDLTVLQLQTAEHAGMAFSFPAGTTNLVDQASNLVNLSTSDIDFGAFENVRTIASNDTTLQLNVAQVEEIEANDAAGAAITLQSATGVPELSDTAANISSMTSGQLAGLAGIGIGAVFASPTPADQNLELSITQAQALASNPGLQVLLPVGTQLWVGSTALALENLQPADIQALGQLPIALIDCVDPTLTLTAAQAAAIYAYLPNATLTLPAGGSVSVTDIAAYIDNFLDLQGWQLAAIDQQLGVTSLVANDGPLTLNVQQLLTLEAANTMDGTATTLASATGAGVVLSDLAANIEALTAAQILAGKALGLTGVTATDTGLTLSVDQALAFADPLPLTVPAGDQVVVADTQDAVAALTAGQLEALANIGVTTVDVAGLDTNPGTLTVTGGITLAIDGAVPGPKVIDFAGPGTAPGGVLALDATPEMQGAIDGFSPVDSIDLTDIADDPAGTASLDPSGGNMLDITEHGSTYQLQLDPTQVFLTAPSFILSQDAGTGTDISYTQSPVNFGVAAMSGQTVDGIVIAGGGIVTIDPAAVANRTVIQDGGVLDVFGTATDTTIENGGTLHLESGASAGGTIGFAPVAENAAGGTLIIDSNVQQAETIGGFAAGDTIDLTGASFDPSAAAHLDRSNNVLTITESNGTTTLQFDPAQHFAAGSYFTPTADSGTGTELQLVICFMPGTRIAVPGGERAVETLRIGDAVLRADGSTGRVRWLGRQSIHTQFADKLRHLPIRIAAGALGNGLPRRDLLVSPDHALCIDGVLVQAGALVNGAGITRAHDVPEIFTYYHVELADHALLLAEGVPAESFVDNVTRRHFDNWDEHEALYGHHPPIRELPMPRAKSWRQLPGILRARLLAA